MNRSMLAKANSGFIDPLVGLKICSLSRAQTNRSFVCSQLESGLRLPLPVDFPLPFAPFPDRLGPEERAIWAGASVFGGTPGTWKDRDQWDELGGAGEIDLPFVGVIPCNFPWREVVDATTLFKIGKHLA